VSLTAEGRVTEHILQLNRLERLRLRRVLITSRRYPR
jgi:hypothetical protein